MTVDRAEGRAEAIRRSLLFGLYVLSMVHKSDKPILTSPACAAGSGTTYNLTYNAENQLTSVNGGATASFMYDGDGNRVKGTVGGVTTNYIGNYLEWTGSTSTMKRYYYAVAQRVAMQVGSVTGTTGLSWLFGDPVVRLPAFG